MEWFFFSLICILGWGLADLFYKKGTDSEDRFSHLKIAVWVGMVMGAVALVLLPFSETGFSLPGLLENAVRYSPASLAYIVSMVIGYAGLRYLEVSIVSPVQNASGAFSMIAMLIIFAVTGTVQDDLGDLSPLNLVGTVLIVLGVITLAILENLLARREANALAKTPGDRAAAKKAQFGALALLFPLLYCLFDTIGTAADGIILDEETGLGLGEIDVLILYGLTFLAAGIVCWVFLWIKNKKPYNPFEKAELLNKGMAACFEEFGQVFYVFAMARKPVLAAPMGAADCSGSVLLSRIILKENIGWKRYLCVGTVILGIVMLGIAEGLGEIAE